MKDQILMKLKEEGWNIKEEFFESIFEKPGNFQSTSSFLANSDFKDCGAPSLPNDIGKNKNNLIKSPLVLQVTNVRNVSAPKANEGSATAPRMLRLTLTDGVHYVHGLEISFIKSLSLKTPPGTKIKLYSKIPVIDRYLLLSPSNTELIGGVVEELYQKWKLSESVSKYSRSGVLDCDGTGPPPWVPFGKKIMVEKEKDFKAMEDSAAKKKENDDFEHQRQQVVMELTKESSQKVFGGGKQMLDSNVQKIINSGGFTIDEAEWALKRNKNDLKKALQDLRRNQSCNPEDTRGTTSGYEERERGRGRGGKRGRGRGKGKDNKGPDGSDDELPHSAVFRPSGPASLLDYLESRISEKSGGGEAEPKYKTEKYDDDRYYPRGRSNSRRSRGRGRGGAGEGGYFNRQSGNKVPKSEPTFSVENWPSLGQEKAAEEKKNIVHSEASSHREAGVRNSSHENKFEVQNSYSKKKPEGVSQPIHTNSSNKNYQYQDSFNNQSYLGSNNSSINSNRSETPQSHQHQNFRGDTYQQFNSSDSYTYEDTRKEPQRRRNEQSYFKRGVGRDLHRGSSGSLHSGNQMYGNNSSTQSYYNQEESHYRTDHVDSYCANTQRVHTPKEKELIAQFERSMVMAGHYDPNYMQQNSGGYSQGYQQHQNYDNYSYSNRGFAGTYEFHRGGDGYPRRSRGRRGGRY